jgi:hypothetical protein
MKKNLILSDPALLINKAFVDGQWINAFSERPYKLLIQLTAN